MSGGIAIFGFTPEQGPIDLNVTIQGQDFNPNPASDTVKFNGVLAAVVSASSTSIVATVPSNSTTGPISVTVNSQTAISTDNFTVIPVRRNIIAQSQI